MRPIPGSPPTEVSELARVQDRVSFVYLERCTVHRHDNAVTAQDVRGVVHIPAASIGALLLGPGTRVTHQAMTLLADSGATAVWVGEQGVRYYAHGRSLASTSRWVAAQAEAVTNQSKRLTVARAMYAMRFPGEDVTGMTMQQLRGREGARVRNAYRDLAAEHGVEWKRRDYDSSDFASSDVVNQALSAATTCLYGVAHAVIVSLGCAPALGFIHTGHARSFVFDVADLYKVELAVPAAFEIAGREVEDVGAETRRLMRDRIHHTQLLTRCVRDVQKLLAGDDGEAVIQEWDVVYLWDGANRKVVGGQDYSDDVPW